VAELTPIPSAQRPADPGYQPLSGYAIAAIDWTAPTPEIDRADNQSFTQQRNAECRSLSQLQRKALTPNDFADLDALEARLLAFQDRYNKTAEPFDFPIFAYGGAGLIKHKLEVLQRHCEDVGRDYEEIERTALGSVNLGPESMSPHDVIRMCSDLSEAGIQHLIFNMPNVHKISPLETFGREIIPAVAGLCSRCVEALATAVQH